MRLSHLRRVVLFVAISGLAGMLVPGPASAQPDGRGGNPWQHKDYRPQPDQWRPYVLAPSGRQVSPVAVQSADPRGGAIEGDPTTLLGNGEGQSVRLVGAGSRSQSPLLVLDFGKEVGGYLRLHFTGASDTRPQVHLCFSESLSEMAVNPGDNNGEGALAPGCDTANIWAGYPGIPYNYDADSHTLPLDGVALPATVTDPALRGGFRYASIFLDGPGSVDIDGVSLDFTAAPKQADPAAYRGWFLSNDDQLNKIWYAGAYTVQMNTWMPNTAKSWPYQYGEADHADAQVPHADPNLEVIFDGAKRDRIVWQGDLAVQAPVTYLTTHDVSAVDNSLSSLAAQQLPDGFMPAESLVGGHNFDEIRGYGEYVTWFVHNMYEHWLYTGDHDYLQRWWPALVRATNWLESVRQQDSQGLIAFGKAGSCGHYGYADCGHQTYVNALYMRNLVQMSELAAAMGADGSDYAARAAALKDTINSVLWDGNVGAYRMSTENPNVYPQDANATAVLTGVAAPEQASSAMAYLRANNWSTYGSLSVSPSTPNGVLSPSYEPLPSGFEADARVSIADPDGLQLMRTFWGYQLSQDPRSTFWEKANTQGRPGIAQFTSLAHGWAAAPTATLTTRVLGVSPTGPGFSSYVVTPHPGDLVWAQGVVPTPHGDIRVSWQRRGAAFRMTTDSPAGTVGRLSLPTSSSNTVVMLDGQTVFGARADGLSVGPGHHVVEATG